MRLARSFLQLEMPPMSILTTLVLELPCLALHWAGYLLLPPPVFTSLPQLMQVIFSPRRTWTPLHLGHGTLVSVPPFARREAPVLILLTLSSEEAMVEGLLPHKFFLYACNTRDIGPFSEIRYIPLCYNAYIGWPYSLCLGPLCVRLPTTLIETWLAMSLCIA